MARNCNTPTFVEQTGLSRTLNPQSGSAASFAEQQAGYIIQLGADECCGGSNGEVVVNDFIYDGTWFHDGTIFYGDN